MALIYIRKNESMDSAIERFNQVCIKENIIAEILKRVYYKKPSAIRHRKKYHTAYKKRCADLKNAHKG